MSGLRGYVEFNPTAETAYWLERAQLVVDDYRSSWPLTVRQVFYRMVAAHGFPKREADYKRLVGIIAKARRASLVGSDHGIPFAAIRDDRGRAVDPFYYAGELDFVDSVAGYAESYRIDRRSDQPQLVELWCEAAGMVPIVTEIADPYGLRVSSGGGYDSVTAKHQLATRAAALWKAEGRPTLVLHVGDFDPSGENLCDVLRDDVTHMVTQQIGGRVLSEGRRAFDVQRVALTARQVVDRQVITAPAKPTDARQAAFLAKYDWLVEELGTESIAAQLEALEPAELSELMREAIVERLDRDVYDETLARERDQRESLIARIDAWRESEER